VPSLPFLLGACAETFTPIEMKNAGFEEPAMHGIPQWMAMQHVDQMAYEMAVDQTIAAQGRASARIRQLHPQVFGQILQSVTLPDNAAGRHLRLRAAVRTQGADGKGLSLGFDFRGARDDQARASSNAVRGNSDWHDLTVEATVPPGVREIGVMAILQGAGTAWIDQVRLDLGP
jgi:hypothetical protein